MKLTITNTAKNPTAIWLRGGGLRELASGETGEDLDIEDGQAGAYAKQVGLDVKGYKAPPAASTDGRKTDHKQADAALQARVTELEGLLTAADTAVGTLTAERDALAAQLADLGEQDDADPADDLRKQAIGLGLKLDKRWSDETVQRKIDEKLAE